MVNIESNFVIVDPETDHDTEFCDVRGIRDSEYVGSADFFQRTFEQVAIRRYDIQESNVAGPDLINQICSDNSYRSAIAYFAVQAVYVPSERVFAVDTYLELLRIVGPLGELCEVVDKAGFDGVLRDVFGKRRHGCLCYQYGSKHQYSFDRNLVQDGFLKCSL